MRISAETRTSATVAATILCGALALPAHAGITDDGWRVGVSALFATYKLDSGEIDDNAAGVLAYGEYRFNRILGVKAGYLNTGDFEQDDLVTGTPATTPQSIASINTSGFTANVVGYVPLPSENFQVFGQAGYYRLDQELEVDGENTSTRFVDGLTLGAGADIAVADQWGIRLEGGWYDLDGADFWTVALGFNYQFGKPDR